LSCDKKSIERITATNIEKTTILKFKSSKWSIFIGKFRSGGGIPRDGEQNLY
jgi:hypothetical protein